MLINKLQTSADVKAFRELPAEQLDAILRDTPSHLMSVIASVLMAYLLKVNVPVHEAEDLVGKVKEKKMAELFANMEPMDIHVANFRQLLRVNCICSFKYILVKQNKIDGILSVI